MRCMFDRSNLKGAIVSPLSVVHVQSRESLPTAASPAADETSAESAWLERFHRGDRDTLEGCYREHFATVANAIRPLLRGADRETVIHDLFARLIAREDFRRGFRGGSLGAWLRTVARNQAIDFQRRLRRELATSVAHTESEERGLQTASWEEAAHARLLVEDFRRQHVPAAWQGVFELRFLQQLPQRAAAARLSLSRTTLVYREIRLRRLLKRFFLSRRGP
jgi:RNA polymerase sigma-70 factor, ECF subfamily